MDVSIVIVSYNSKDIFRDCLESIFKYTEGVSFEVIVVDNASTDGVVEYLREAEKNYGKRLKVIYSQENTGFSKGNNLGIRQASGKYILLLNNDTKLVENAVKSMFVCMEGKPDFAVASCQLVDSENRLSPTGGYAPTLARVASWALFLDDLPLISRFFPSYHPHVSDSHWQGFFLDLPWIKKLVGGSKTATETYKYDKEFYPDWVTGAFFFIRRTALDQLGGLDEGIFMYGEELEWCMRARMAGWKVGYTPITKIIHLERGSQGGLPRGALLGEFRGLKYIYGKYFPVWKQLLLGTLLDIAAFLRVIFWLARLKPQMAKIYLEALLL